MRLKLKLKGLGGAEGGSVHGSSLTRGFGNVFVRGGVREGTLWSNESKEKEVEV